MIRFRASFYDGRSSRRTPVELSAGADGELCVVGQGLERRYRLEDVEVSARLGDTPRVLRLPDGGRCETADNEAVDALLAPRPGEGARRVLHRLESRLRYALIALLITVAAGWALVEHGIPWAAAEVAAALPPQVERALGGHGLELLDRTLLEPSRLDPGERARVERVFTAAVAAAAIEPPPRLALRASERLGANAFALPAGVVVLTDALVKLAADDGELAAVIAHELGHLHHRHLLRRLLQSSVTALLVAITLGDLSSISGLSATLPTVLLEQRYSRRFELEADRFAAGLLERLGLPADRLASLLERLARAAPEPGGALSYLASHPPTAERVQALRARR